MTDSGSTPSHDIESLAARAKEMLERVQGVTTSEDDAPPADAALDAAVESVDEPEAAATTTEAAELETASEVIDAPELDASIDGAEDIHSDADPADIDVPDLDEVELQADDISGIELPELTDAELPELTDAELPELTDAELPEIDIPELPESVLSDIEVPDLDVGDVDLPEVPDDLPDVEIADGVAVEAIDAPETLIENDSTSFDWAAPSALDEGGFDTTGLFSDDDGDLEDGEAMEEAIVDSTADVETVDEAVDVDLFADVDPDSDEAPAFDPETSDATAVADEIVSELDADLALEMEALETDAADPVIGLDADLDLPGEDDGVDAGDVLAGSAMAAAAVVGLDAGLDTGPDDPVIEVETEGIEAAGLQLEEDPGFDTVDFGDILSEDVEEVETSELEPSSSYVESMDSELAEAETAAASAAAVSPSMERVAVAERPKPAYSIDGDVDDLFLKDDDDDAAAAAAGGSGCGLRGLLVALAVVALFLVFFGDQFVDWITADDPVEETETDTDITENADGATTETETDTTDASTTSESTTTTETTTTTTEAPTTPAEPPVPATAWEVLGASSNTSAFASLGGPLGLQDRLSSLSDYTLFAPSDDAVAQLTPEQLGALAADPEQAAALLDYHIVEGQVSAADLLANDGGQLQSINGLPILVTIEDGQVVLNGTTRVDAADFAAETSTVHVVDSVLQPPTINQVLNLGNIQFEVISSRLTPEGIAELDKAVAFFNENPDARALIEGHTDTDGDADANQRLSERRANAVRQYLVDQGIAGDRLEAQGFGESQPVIVNGSEDKVASRRIEFVLR